MGLGASSNSWTRTLELRMNSHILNDCAIAVGLLSTILVFAYFYLTCPIGAIVWTELLMSGSNEIKLLGTYFVQFS
jgi:hypothetical protein